MSIPKPWDNPAAEPAETTPNGAHEPEREPARERARDYTPTPGPSSVPRNESSESHGSVVPFPDRNPDTVAVTDGDEKGMVGQLRSAANTWVTEARESATAAADQSAWRVRPPALRDLHTRIQRAEWAGDIPLLQVAGAVYGYIALVITAATYGALWVLARPLRLAVALLLALVTVWTW